MRLGLPRRLGDRVLVIGVLALVLIAVGSLALALAVRALQHTTSRARHSSSVLNSASMSEKLVLDIETGARGFVIRRRSVFLEPWFSGRRELPGELARLRDLTRDDPVQAARARRVTQQIDEYVHNYSEPLVAEARRDLARAQRVTQTLSGKRRVDAIRRTFAAMFARENALLSARDASAGNRATFAYLAVAGGGLLAVLALVALILFTRRSVARPLGRVEEAARRMTDGDLTARSGVSGTDEVGTTGAAFDVMAASLQREQERSQRATDELVRSNEELEQFAYVASHDLSEPLRVVAGFTDLLARRSAGTLTPDTQGYINRILSGTERMQQLIDDLLRYSRVGRAELDLQPLDLDRVAAEAAARLEVSRQEVNAEIVLDPLPAVEGDERQLAVVFQNLLANALKFGKPGGAHHIHVSGARDGDTAVIRVADDGIGIAPEHRERIFRMFQRLHTRSEYPGTGIGLALCQRIVDRHHGEIRVEDTPGGGATFVIRLPAPLKGDGAGADHPVSS